VASHPVGDATIKRRVVAERWDTLFTRWLAVEDTVFAEPWALELWGDRIAVLDNIDQKVVFLDLEGRTISSVGRKGGGPEEFGWMIDVYVGREGDLWVVDAGNRRLARIDGSLAIASTSALPALPGLPLSVVALEDGHAVTLLRNPGSDYAIHLLDSDLRWRDSLALPWPEPIGDSISLSARAVADPDDSARWVVALMSGPGFFTWTDGHGRPHRYVEEVPFQPGITREMMARAEDEGRNAALALVVTGGEIYVLFGGRPQRSAHDMEPTRYVDVYGIEGDYRRSYLLPGHTTDIATDGKVFYVIQEEPEYGVLALVPRTVQ
jgi:hypothetical protein